MINTKIDQRAFSAPQAYMSERELAESHGAQYISCKDDPHYLKTCADIITGRVAEMRAELPDNVPLVLLMSEAHPKPFDLALGQVINSSFLESGQNFTLPREDERTTWQGIARHHMSQPIPDDLFNSGYFYDPSAQAGLSSFLGFLEMSDAPFSSACDLSFLYQKKINVCFSDLHEDSYGRIVFDEALCKEYNTRFPAHSPVRLGGNISSRSKKKEWMGLRNLGDVFESLAHMRHHKANVIFKPAGGNHLFGDEEKGYPYDQSLCALYRVAGAAVLPVIINVNVREYGCKIGVENLPQEAHAALEGAIVIGDSPNNVYFNEKYVKQVCRVSGGRRVLPFTEGAEEAFWCGELFNASAGQLSCSVINRSDAKKYAKKDIDACLERYHQSLG